MSILYKAKPDEVKFVLIDHNSPQNDKQKMRSLLEGFELKFISLDIKKFNFEFFSYIN